MDQSRRAGSTIIDRYRRLWPWAIVFVLAGALLGFWPLPYYVYAPWSAGDLDRSVHVAGHTPPPGTLYDTTILILPGRPATFLAAKALPGWELAPRTDLAPPSVSDLDVLRYMYQSQEAGKRSAEIVAARAAGLPVDLKPFFVVSGLSKEGPKHKCFKPGDQLISVDGQPIVTARTLGGVADREPAGATFHIVVKRRGANAILACTTALIQGRPRFGIFVGEFDEVTGKLPISVTYTLPLFQSGGSTGLMFALQIYRSLTGADLTHGAKIAGTGVIDDSGNVLKIVGARQKIIAARRAGASVFIVPQANAEDVRGVTGMTVIPVSSFNEAVNWLTWRRLGCARAASDIVSLTGIAYKDLPIGDADVNGLQLPAGILRMDYGHAACNLIRFWYFWRDQAQPLHVRFAKGSLRSVTLSRTKDATMLEAVDEKGRRYAMPLVRPPDALVGYYISNRPGLALWTSPATYEYVGFDARGISLYHAQPISTARNGGVR